MRTILYIDACLKRETHSRTERLAQAYLKTQAGENAIQTVILEETVMHPLSEERLSFRENAIDHNDFSDPSFELAKLFSEADELVIAAPYWDLSFPASLKVYLEQICVRNLTFRYNEQGIPCGLTKIRKVSYFTTAGGYIGSNNFGYDYVKGLFCGLFGIQKFCFYSAEGLDIYGNDPEKILAETIEKIEQDVTDLRKG